MGNYQSNENLKVVLFKLVVILEIVLFTIYGCFFSIIPNKFLLITAVVIIALNYIYYGCQKFDIRLLFLMYIYVIVAIEEWILGVTDYSNILLLPALIYLSIKYINDYKPVLGLITGLGIQAFLVLITQNNAEMYLAIGKGCYLDNTTVLLFLCCLMLATVFFLNKIISNKYIIITICFGIIVFYLYTFINLLNYSFSEWLLAQQRALIEIKNGEWFFGVFVFDVETTKCYFTEYASEYGFLVFGLLVTFTCLFIKDLILYICNEKVNINNKIILFTATTLIFINMLFTDDAMRTKVILYVFLILSAYIRCVLEQKNQQYN